MRTRLPEGDALEKSVRELGVGIQGGPRFQSASGIEPRAPDYELQRRYIEAKRSIRESRLWIVALVSAVASACSAATALYAVGWWS